MLARADAIMAATSIKRFNWVRSATFRERNDAWRARQQAMRDNFETASSAASSAFGAASINLVAGLGSIVAQKASQRAQADAIVKQLNILA
jgi:hypothetical protein